MKNIRTRIYLDERGMLYPDSVHCDGETVGIDYPNEEITGVQIMFDSGVKDQHGTPIFEEDILAIARPHFDVYRTRVVFENGAFGFYLGNEFFALFDPLFHAFMTVIGNTFEHPHLEIKEPQKYVRNAFETKKEHLLNVTTGLQALYMTRSPHESTMDMLGTRMHKNVDALLALTKEHSRTK